MARIRGYRMLMLAGVGALAMASGLARSQDAKPAPGFKVEEQDTIAAVLKRMEGKAVKIRLVGQGEELSGKVQKVGKDVVHLSGLAGREFYDAAIRIDQIAAVVGQAR